MKKRLIGLLLCIIVLAFVFTGTVQANGEAVNTNTTKVTTTVATTKKKTEFKKYTLYTKNKTKVRMNPSSKSKVVKTLPKAKKVTVIAKSGDWRKVGKDQWINKNDLSKKNPNDYYQGVKLQYNKPYNITKNKLTRSGGVAYYNGAKETWYSQKVLPGKGLKIPGRHVADDGTIRDEKGYIVIACNPSFAKKGTKRMTSLGPGKVYDCGCAYGIVDVYVNWG